MGAGKEIPGIGTGWNVNVAQIYYWENIINSFN